MALQRSAEQESLECAKSFSAGYLIAQAWEQDAPLAQVAAVAAVAQALVEQPGFADVRLCLPSQLSLSSLQQAALETTSVRVADVQPETRATRLVTSSQLYAWHAEEELAVRCAPLSPRFSRLPHAPAPALSEQASITTSRMHCAAERRRAGLFSQRRVACALRCERDSLPNMRAG